MPHPSEAIPTPDSRPADSTLSIGDVVSLIIGIVVGVSIFKVPGAVFALSGSPGTALFIWGLGAVLALSGALCYAELAATYPQFGAEYIYLGRAYGKRIGFLFGWMQTCAVLPGSIGAMAFVFADYAATLQPGWKPYTGLIAAGAIAGLTLLQLLGFVIGKVAQNLLTAVKVISLAGVLICGLLLTPVPLTSEAGSAAANLPVTESSPSWSGLGLALVFVLYAYGGWSDVATMTPEVRDCRRNMPRALLIGLTLIAILYLALNLSFLKALGVTDVREVEAPAAEVIRRALGPTFSGLMSLIIMASALGAIHGTLFAGCRLLLAMGQDFPLFHRWSRWNSRHVPVWSLLTISGISLVLTSVVGNASGRGGVDRLLEQLSIPTPEWEKFGGGFEVLVTASAPIFWTFFMLSGLSLIVLRLRDPGRPRPFRVPGYPLTPLIFTTSAAGMLWSSAAYAGRLTLLLTPIFLIGIVLAITQKPQPQSE